MLRLFEHRQVYRPSPDLECAPEVLGRPVEDVYFQSTDGTRLNAWFYPPDPASPRSRDVFLFCHGNGRNISYRVDLYDLLLKTGAGVFAFDYRGYGKSEGSPGEHETYADAEAAYQWLITRGYTADHIIVIGESLGGGVAAELLLRKPARALILTGAFTCISDIGSELFPWLPVRWLSTIKYDTCSKLPRITVPVMIMHSIEDNLIDTRHAKKNFTAANEPKLFWEIRGTHNDPLADPAMFRQGLDRFLEMIDGPEIRAGSQHR